LSEQMMDAWAAFARHGDPNVPALPDWPRYDSTRRATLLFDLPCTLVDDPRGEERVAWDRVPLETTRYWPSSLR
jgi:para-nitrobenzyl esterase